MSDATLADLSARYVRFAEDEARGRSPLYEALALGAAGDADALGFLATLPIIKQQPNLLLAAVRLLFGVLPSWQDFRRELLANTEAVRAVMLSRATQTNEPGRCALLLPVLARLPQPLALLEVGASAGLCLLPDRYGYDYGAVTLKPVIDMGAHPTFKCATSNGTPPASSMPQIVWRAGLDLEPIDVRDPDQVAWLEALVWPEQTERLANLRAAIRIAAADPPRVIRGDLLGRALPDLCGEAPGAATLVIFHTAVLMYVTELSDRENFATTAESLCRYWISNEKPGVFPSIAGRVEGSGPPGGFLMSVNSSPTAWTDAHGKVLEWIATGH